MTVITEQLRGLLEKLPAADLGFRWEARNKFTGSERIEAHGSLAALLYFVTTHRKDLTDALSALDEGQKAEPVGAITDRGYETTLVTSEMKLAAVGAYLAKAKKGVNPVALVDAIDAAMRLSSARPSSDKMERLRVALLRMEHACEQLASTRSMEIYGAMIDGGQADLLLELDNARKAARAALQPSQGEK